MPNIAMRHCQNGWFLQSGSGKTSLVNALAGRLEGGAVSGSVLVNGREREKSFKNISGCGMQPEPVRVPVTAVLKHEQGSHILKINDGRSGCPIRCAGTCCRMTACWVCFR